MIDIFPQKLSAEDIAQLDIALDGVCICAWSSPNGHFVSALMFGHPRSAVLHVNVLLMLDRTKGQYVEIDAWLVFIPMRKSMQSDDAIIDECAAATVKQITVNEQRWSQQLRGLVLDQVCGDPERVAEAAGLFVMPIIDESHLHPWPVSEWMAKMHCTTTFEQATPATVANPSAMTIEDKHYTARPVDIGTSNPVTVETEAEVSSEDVIHALIGIQRGWQLAQQLGLDGIESPTAHPIVIEKHGPNVIRPDRVQLSMESLRSLSSGKGNRTYVAVAILIAMHFRMATASAPIDDLEAMRLGGCSHHFVTQVLALIVAPEEHGDAAA